MGRRQKELAGPRWQQVRRAALVESGYRCRKCQKAGRLEVDHVRPLYKGGSRYGLSNLQVLCRKCHFEKSAADRGKVKTRNQKRWESLVESLLK